jgi:hypothetical protein
MPGTRSIRSLAQGVRVALATPSYIERRLPELMERSHPQARIALDPAAAIKAAHRALRVLARIPGSPWRNTCLYRSVAECVLLRAYGVPARLCIGVERQPASAPGVAAHAWVESDAEDLVPKSAPPSPSTVRLVGAQPPRPYGR